MKKSSSKVKDIQFDSVFTVATEITKEEFLREALVAIAMQSESPIDVVHSDFGEVQESVKEVMQCSAHVESDYTASIGYDRVEQYQSTERRYIMQGERYTYHGVTKIAASAGHYDVDCIKERTVTDWHPYSGHISGDEVRYEINGESDSIALLAGVILENVKEDSITEEGYAEVSAESLELAKKSCRYIVESRIQYPGDRHKNETSSAVVTVEELVCYKLPYYEVEYTYEGKKYKVRGFACGKLEVLVEVPPNNVNIEEVAENDTKKFKISKVSGWSASLGLYAFAWIMFAVGVYWTWIFPTVALVTAVVLHLIYNKKYSEKIKVLKEENVKLKRTELEDVLSQRGYSPLNEKEKAYFDEKKEAESYLANHKKRGVLLWSILGVVLSVILIITSCVASYNKKQEKMRSSENVVLSVVDKTQTINGAYYVTKVTYNIRNNSPLIVMGIEGDVRFYNKDELISSSRMFINNVSIQPYSDHTLTLEYKGMQDVNKKMYNISYEDLGVQFEVYSITFKEKDADYGQPTIYKDTEMTYIKTPSSYGSSNDNNEDNSGSNDNNYSGDNSSSNDNDYSGNNSGSNDNDYSGDNSSSNDNDYNVAPPAPPSNNNTELYINTETVSYGEFQGNTTVEKIVFGDNVKTIGVAAFSGCSSLTSINIPNSVTSIGKSAFYGCSSLTSVTIGENVTSIGEHAFYNCTALTEIKFNATAMNNFSSRNVFANAWQSGTGIKVTIGKNVTKLPAYLFCPYSDISYSPKITNVEFEEGGVCTSIGSSAFSGCNSLTSITIPESVTSIGSSAFYNCTALTEIKFNATAMNDLSYSNYVFYNAGQSREGIKVTIGKNVTKLPAYLFDSENYITSVEFEEGSVCTSIGTYAFAYCSSLTSITIGENVQTIGSYAFASCDSLTEIKFNAIAMNDLSEDNSVFYQAGQSGEGIKVTIGKNVTKIPAYLFNPSDYSPSSPKITSVEFEEGSVCASIGKRAFYGCCGLTNIEIPSSVIYVGNSAFAGCSKLVEVINKSSALNLTKGGTSNGYLGYYAKQIFSEKPTVSNFILNNNYEFYNDNGTYYLLGYTGTGTELILPTAIKGSGYKIISHAFYVNNTITSVNITNNVSEVGSYVFYGCDALKNITIGSGVQSIGSYAFYNCTALTEIKFNATAMNDLSYSDNVFENAGQSGTGIKVTIGKNVTKIPAYLFYSNYGSSHSPKITSVVFEEGSVCNSIGCCAFAFCSSLSTVTFADTSTWYYTSSENHNYTGGTQVNVENTTINAYYLQDDYCNYYWYKV